MVAREAEDCYAFILVFLWWTDFANAKSSPTCDFSENKKQELVFLFSVFSQNLGGSRGIRTPDFLGVNETL